MPTTPLLPLPEGLEILTVSATEQELQIRLTSNRLTALCSRCSTPSHSVHSSYRRRPLELPCAGQCVHLELVVKKFFCRQESCPQKIFAERLPGFLEPNSRRTTRLRVVVQSIAGAFNAKGGAHLGIHFSRMTSIRSLLAISLAPVDQVNRVGRDDFCWKRGRSSGTVVVDLATHAIIDVLPGRETAPVQTWLEEHEEIELVSRDRGGNDADGATQGTPQAIQCADRWHLCANLGEAVERFLIRTHTHLPEVNPQTSEPGA